MKFDFAVLYIQFILTKTYLLNLNKDKVRFEMILFFAKLATIVCLFLIC